MWNPLRKGTAAVTTAEHDELRATPADFAWIIGKLWWERKHPFSRQDWHVSTVLIPEEWDAAFELSAWANQCAQLLKVIENGRLGTPGAAVIADALIAHLNSMGRAGEYVAGLMSKLALAAPLPENHPVFTQASNDSVDLAVCRFPFGRANAALEQIEMPEAQRLEALCKLGSCLVLATHNATIYFGVLTEKLRLLEPQ